MLLRKLWGSGRSSSSTSRLSNPNSNSNSSWECGGGNSSSNKFDEIPWDVFVEILKLVGANQCAKMSIVCKSWKSFIASNYNHLWIFFLQNQHQYYWDAILFSHIHLTNAYPLRSSYHLSYMDIYAKQAQLTTSVIIDGGSGYCKFGWSEHSSPSGLAPTFPEFGNVESPLYSRLRHFFATIYKRMTVRPSLQPVVVSIPICHCDDNESAKAARRQLKEAIYSVLFDMNVPAVCAINQAVLALFAARKTSGIVVNIGFQVISVVPVFQGEVMHKVGVEVVGQGALNLTGFLKDQMIHQNIGFGSMNTVRALKENLCYVAADYEAELSKDTQASLEIPEEGCITLSTERFKTGEILFQPRMGGMRAMGLHQAVALCMDHCQAAELSRDAEWFKNIILAGGTACLPGLSERLEKELHRILPPSMSNGIQVIPPQSAESAWFGAKMISNLSSFREAWCISKKQFRKKVKRK